MLILTHFIINCNLFKTVKSIEKFINIKATNTKMHFC